MIQNVTTLDEVELENLALPTIPNYHCADSALIIQCQRGDKQAFGELVKRYMKRAYFTALSLVGSRDAALDLSQDAFIRAYRSIKKFNPDSKFFTWYYRILKNLCLNFIRDSKRHARAFSEIDETMLARIPDDSADTSRRVEKEQVCKEVWRAINSLKPNEREIIILKDFQELSYKEIADLLDCPIGTVMSRLYNARQALKLKLERYVS